jgi:tyrosinase
MADSLSYRQNVDALAPADLQNFRAGITAAKAISDNRGYQYFAGIHGIPQFRCHHGDLLFLPWHRAYLYTLELTFRELSAGFTLAYWEWNSPTGQTEGIPPAYTAATDASGNPNTLLNAPANIDPATVSQLQSNPDTADSLDYSVSPPLTIRNPDPPASLPSQAAVQSIIDTTTTFTDFSHRIEQVHNNVHGWVGGTMGVIPVAAYDPVFWAHHTNIDRIWYLWQVAHPGAQLPSSIANTALDGFNMTVADTLDINHLGYEYVITAATT